MHPMPPSTTTVHQCHILQMCVGVLAGSAAHVTTLLSVEMCTSNFSEGRAELLMSARTK